MYVRPQDNGYVVAFCFALLFEMICILEKIKSLSLSDDNIITHESNTVTSGNDHLIYFSEGKESGSMADNSFELTTSKWNVSVFHCTDSALDQGTRGKIFIFIGYLEFTKEL